jgi:hypothetical protein
VNVIVPTSISTCDASGSSRAREHRVVAEAPDPGLALLEILHVAAWAFLVDRAVHRRHSPAQCMP